MFAFYFIAGWRDSFFSISKKWLSTSQDCDEFGFPEVSNNFYYNTRAHLIGIRI